MTMRRTEMNVLLIGFPAEFSRMHHLHVDGIIISADGTAVVVRTPIGDFSVRIIDGGHALPGEHVRLTFIKESTGVLKLMPKPEAGKPITAAAVISAAQKSSPPESKPAAPSGGYVRPEIGSKGDGNDPAASQARASSERFASAVTSSISKEPTVGGRLTALIPRPGAGMAESFAFMICAVGAGGAGSWIGTSGIEGKKAISDLDLTLFASDADIPGNGKWSVRSLPVIVSGRMSRVIWAEMLNRKPGHPYRFVLEADLCSAVGRFQMQGSYDESMLDLTLCTATETSMEYLRGLKQAMRTAAAEAGAEIRIRTAPDADALIDLIGSAYRVNLKV